MNPPALLQNVGNICVGLAALVLLLPLQFLLSDYARKHVNDDQWMTPALFILVPLWLLLMGGLLCMTASGGFDGLRLGRSGLHAFAVAASFALAVVTFASVGLYIRPGFTPRAIYYPIICLVPLGTMLLVVLGLNPRLASAIPIQWVRLPWIVFTALSLAGCALFLGPRLVRAGMGGVAGLAHRIGNLGPSPQKVLAEISALDPETEFVTLLWRTHRDAHPAVREAAAARLRSLPQFPDRMATMLESGHVEPAVAFVRDNPLSPEERKRLAQPARKAMERWVDRIPGPNFTTKKHLKDLKSWGTEAFRALTEKFAGTGVDFGPVMQDFQDKVEPQR